jgi:hypothetical protein
LDKSEELGDWKFDNKSGADIGNVIGEYDVAGTPIDAVAF